VFTLWTFLSIPVFVLSMAGSGSAESGAGNSVELDAVTVGNLGDERNVTRVILPFCTGSEEDCSMDKSEVAQVVVAVDIVGSLVFLMSVCWMRACVQLEELQSTGGFLSARDYTLKVDCIPPDLTEWELRAHFTELAKREAEATRAQKAMQEARQAAGTCGACCGTINVPDVPPGPVDEGAIAEVFLAEDCEQLFELCMARGSLIKKLDRAWAAMESRTMELETMAGVDPGHLPRNRAEQDARLQELIRDRDAMQQKVKEATDKAKGLKSTSGVLTAFVTFERAEDAARVLRQYGNGDVARWFCLPRDLWMLRAKDMDASQIQGAKRSSMAARLRRAARAISSLYQAAANLQVPEGHPQAGGALGVEEWLEDGGAGADLALLRDE